MKRSKLIDRLNYSYFKENKKDYLVLMISMFLTVFLLMSIFIVKDSYHYYHLKNNHYQYGKWEIRYSAYLDKRQLKKLKNISKQKLYVKHLDFKLKPNSKELITFQSISNFNHMFPIHLTTGNYPKNKNEVIINEQYAKEYSLKCNEVLSFYDENNYEYSYKISGTYKNLITYTIPSFYTFMDNQSDYDEIYAIVDQKSFSEVANFETISVNNPVCNAKYLNHTLTYLFIIAIIFIFLVAFLLLYNVYQVYLRKKQNFLTQLYTLGMSKKQEKRLLFRELFTSGFLLLMISLIISYIFWYIIIYLTSSIIQNLLNFVTPFACHLYIQSWLILIFLIFMLFLLLIVITSYKIKRNKLKLIKYKTFKLKWLPTEFRLGIIDIIRKRVGFSIVISAVVCITLFTSVQYLLNTWFELTYKDYIYENNNVDINLSLYELTNDKFTQFNEEYAQLKKQKEIIDSKLMIQWFTNSTLEDSHYPIKIYCIDDLRYKKYLKTSNLKKAFPILVNHFMHDNKENVIPLYTDSESINVNVLSKTGKLIHTFQTPYILNEEITLENVDQDTFILLISNTQFKDWLRKYPGGSMNGNISMNASHPENIEAVTSKLFSINENDYLYVHNLEERYQDYQNTKIMIQFLLYSFIILIALVCIMSISNVIFQYQNNRIKDRNLLHTLGMTQKQWTLQTLSQSLFFAILIILIAIPLIWILIVFIYQSYFSEKIALFFPYLLCIISLIITSLIIFIISLHYSKKH